MHDVVWSGVIGSLIGSSITVLGVLLTNLGLSKRHKEQLDHAARESTIKREMELRKDIYIPTVEATVIALGALGSMADPTVKQSDVTEKINDALAKIAKANAIAKVDAVSALGDLVVGLGDLFQRLSIGRAPILNWHNRMIAENGVINRAVGDNGKWVQLQTQLLFQGPLDPQKAEFIVGQINFTQEQIAHWSAKRDESNKEMLLAQIEFLKILAQFQPDVSRKANNAYIFIRREFEFSNDDLESVREISLRNTEKGQEFLRRTIAGFEIQAGERRNPG